MTLSSHRHAAVSTVIPTYNRADCICRAVRSALEESLPGDQVIVVDDGSTDGTDAVLRPWLSRITYVRVEHAGVGSARNRGIAVAANPLVAFLDSDDWWIPGKLPIQRALLSARPDVLFCFSDHAAARSSTDVRHRIASRNAGLPRDKRSILGAPIPYSTMAQLPAGWDDFDVYVGDMYKALMERQMVSSITALVCRAGAGTALKFAEDVAWAEDWECFGRLAGKGLAAYLDCETAVADAQAGRPRLSDPKITTMATSRIAVLGRVWGSDPTFMAAHRGEYETVLARALLLRVRGLIKDGRPRQARAELKQIRAIDMARRIFALGLSFAPGSLVPGIESLARKVMAGKTILTEEAQRLHFPWSRPIGGREASK